MLDLETRRRIDNARDILVGKVPDPKSQVEQITIALIYKFMDDMDNEAKELGGKASFFKGEFAKYSWSNIFDPKLGGVELINLYGEAITKMNQNKNIPQLFRDIFKNAFLPYRDPETLKSFLKEINDFHYDHSERLGDAFEYLLSVLGVQGDAGSLRTPRHIIDFIVEVIDPKKNETILDPACGTAGFLISSYKHILAQNTDKKNGDRLTPDDRKRLIGNIVGYDISPDMMRLSLVNLYLHGFQNPKIYEYDSLTSDDRWNDTFDIILANPPFMTPKGGIRPHKRFSIQANRSEVLFVDYIMEHIATDGRAGVIVPEGIIFQSGNAYKLLRKTLVENNYLYAVVSLPAGVFNPYSGVKTSILLMDRTLAKKTKDILFIKIENDGFDLGAQRRDIDRNNLPDALTILQKYKQSVQEGKKFKISESDKELAHTILKEKIAESGDYNLTGDRYRERIVHSHKDWPMVDLGEIAEIISGQSPEGEYYNDKGNGLPFYQGKADFGDIYLKQPTKWTKQTTKIAEKDDVLISVRAPVGPVNLSPSKICIGRGLAAIRPLNKLNFLFLFYVLRESQSIIKNYGSGSTFESINRSQIEKLKISLPPLSVQQEIVAEIEGYQKIIGGARQIVENYKPRIKVDESWEMMELGDVCNFMTGGTPTSTVKEYYENGTIPWLVSGDIHKGEIFDCEGRITKKGVESSNAKYLPKDSVLIALNGQGKTRGTVALLRMEKATCNQSLVSINPKDKNTLVSEFIYYQLKSMYQEIREITGDNQRSGLNISIVKAIKIPRPPLKIQKQIVAQIEEEQKLVEAINKLIEIFEGKIKAKIAEVWG